MPKSLVITRRHTTVDGSVVRTTAVVAPDDPAYPSLLKGAYKRQALFGEPIPFLEDEPELVKIASRPKNLFGAISPAANQAHEAREAEYRQFHERARSSTPQGMHWITIHPNGAGEGEGRHVLVDDSTHRIEGGNLPPKVIDQINSEHQAPEPAGESPAPVPPMRREPEPTPAPTPQPVAPEPAAAPQAEPSPDAARPQTPTPEPAPAEAPAGPGDTAPPPSPPEGEGETARMAPAGTPAAGEGSLPGATPEANPGPSSAPEPDSGNPEIPHDAESPETRNEPEPGSEPDEGHLAHAALLRHLAERTDHEPAHEALNRAAGQLERIARHASPEDMDDDLLEHRRQPNRLGLLDGADKMKMYFEPGKDFGSNLLPRLREARDIGRDYKGREEGNTFPIEQLHNVLARFPEFHASPRLLARGTDLLHEGRLARTSGKLEEPKKIPLDKLVEESNATPPETPLTPEAAAPIDTAEATWEKAVREHPDVPWAEHNVAKLGEHGGEVSDEEALAKYHAYVSHRFDQIRSLADEGSRSAKQSLAGIGSLMRRLSHYVHGYDSIGRDIERERFHAYRPGESIGHHEPSGKLTFSHSRLDTDLDDYPVWRRPQMKKEKEELRQKVRSLPGYKDDGKQITFSPSNLHTALELFPHHHVSASAMLAAAKAHAATTKPPPAWEHPPEYKTREEGNSKQLLPYQQYAASWMASRQSGIMALDVGLGKTATALAALCKLRQQGRVGKALVIAPKNVLFNWRDEAHDLTHLGVAVMLPEADLLPGGFQKAGDTETQEEKLAKADLVIAGYSGLEDKTERQKAIDRVNNTKADIDRAKKAKDGDEVARLTEKLHALPDPDQFDDEETKIGNLLKRGFDGVIVDEAHRLKNPQAGRSKSFYDNLMDMPTKMLLTGTPMPTTPLDLYNMTNLVKPGVFGKEAQFKARYMEQTPAGTMGGKNIMVDKVYKNLDEAYDTVTRSGAMLAIKRDDPHVMAQKASVGLSKTAEHHYDRDVAMTGAQDELHRHFQSAGLAALDTLNAEMGEKKAQAVIMTLGQRLEQIMLDPNLLATDRKAVSELAEGGVQVSARKIKDLVDRFNAEHPMGAPKYVAAGDLIKERFQNGSPGAVVATTYAKAIPRLKDSLLKQGFLADQIGVISGDTGAHDRQELAKQFNDPKHPMRIMIITSAANEGINLQKGGDTVIHLNHEWTPGQEEQADARVQRTGQERETHHIDLHGRAGNGQRTFDHMKGLRGSQKAKAIRAMQWGLGGGQRIEIPSAFSPADMHDVLSGTISDEDMREYNEDREGL